MFHELRLQPGRYKPRLRERLGTDFLSRFVPSRFFKEFMRKKVTLISTSSLITLTIDCANMPLTTVVFFYALYSFSGSSV